METELKLKEMQKEWHGTIRSYIIGFFGSLILTSLSFLSVISGIFSGTQVLYVIAGLALLQAILQLRYFLHLGQEASPKWESFVFFFMLLILLIIAIGSLWIMHDLNERTMHMQSHYLNQ